MKTTSGQDALTTRAAHGEWTFEHDADGDFGIYWGNKHICTTVSDTTEDEAHARLIIAAPDMLAALKAIVDAWLSPLEKRALKVEMCEAARTAIAKAERGQ